MHRSLAFNGIRKDWLYLLRGRQESPYAPINNTMIRVPGMDGAHVSSSNSDELYVYQPVGFKVTDEEHEQELLDELKEWLITENDTEIQFDNVPGKTYIGRLTLSMSDYRRDGSLRSGTLIFICDPYKYGPEQGPFLFENDALTLNNNGTAEAYPIIEAITKQSVTSFMVAKGTEDFFMIGQPFDIDKQSVEQYPEVSFYPMESLVGWSPMTEGFLFDDEVTGGYVSNGTVEVAGGASFSPYSFGTERAGWYGPAIRRSLPEAIGDFQITFGTSLYSNGNGIGKVFALFLDENDKIVASIGLINTRMGTRNARVLARMNDGQNYRRTRVMDYPGDSGSESTVFSSRPLNIQLKREGNKYYARTWQVRDGEAHARHAEDITSEVIEFQRPIRQVALYFAKYGSNPSLSMQSIGLRVKKNNTLLLDESMIPYIAHAGDKIAVDCKKELVMINDEPVTDLKAFGANYFALDTGKNNLFTFPEGAFDTSIKWRNSFK
ncbi:distal tail protein Dit [Ornithinibacillus salinisoli]|uniref:Distal tail protein Dit n=1 Tax=Ornithinibacillus salinisoli TaxID=1848459 RepID=A0ABW4W2T7_9BACI